VLIYSEYNTSTLTKYTQQKWKKLVININKKYMTTTAIGLIIISSYLFFTQNVEYIKHEDKKIIQEEIPEVKIETKTEIKTKNPIIVEKTIQNRYYEMKKLLLVTLLSSQVFASNTSSIDTSAKVIVIYISKNLQQMLKVF